MITHLIVFIIALIALTKGADLFVEYAAKVAQRFGVSDLLIGLTITSIGTSIPELASSISAAINNAPELIIGNIVGSNIANTGLILGLCAIIAPINTDAKMHDRDGLIMIASAGLLFLASLNNLLSTLEAIGFLIMYIFYIIFVVLSSVDERAYQFKDFMKFVFDFEYIRPVKDKFPIHLPSFQKKEFNWAKDEKRSGLKDLLLLIVSASLIFGGAKFLIEEAIWIAQKFDIPENVVGLTMIAIGTSLPELTVSIAAARRGRGGIVVGNVIGSNTANALLVTGISGTITPLQIAEQSVTYTIPVMLFFSLALVYFVKTDWMVTKTQGFILLVSYIAFIVSTF